SRWEDGSLRGCRFSIGIFDESHTAKSAKSAIVKHLTQLGTDCPLRIQLMGTPLHLTLKDWIGQAQWLFAGENDDGGLVDVPPEVSERQKHGKVALEDKVTTFGKAFRDNKEHDVVRLWDELAAVVEPWFIRRWGETRLLTGAPIASIPESRIRHEQLT